MEGTIIPPTTSMGWFLYLGEKDVLNFTAASPTTHLTSSPAVPGIPEVSDVTCYSGGVEGLERGWGARVSRAVERPHRASSLQAEEMSRNGVRYESELVNTLPETTLYLQRQPTTAH